MSDTENLKPAAVRPPKETIGKISLLVLGAPQGALADDNINKATMGKIVGIVTGAMVRTVKKLDGTVETFEGLKGNFMAIPEDVRRPYSQSSILYLPEGIGGALLERFKEADKNGEIITAEIALEAFVHRAKNPAGYSWGARNIIEEKADASDPMQALLSRAMAPAQAQIAAPEPETVVEGAASEHAKTGKGK